MADSPSPSTAASVVAVGLVALTAGYFIGQGSYIGLFGSSGNPAPASGKAKKSWPNSYDVTIHPDSSDEELMAQQRAGAGARAQAEDSESENEGDGMELKSFANTGEEVKLVLAVRTDLGMGKGRNMQWILVIHWRQSTNVHLVQARLQRSALMQHWLATSTCSTTSHPRLSSNAGKETANQRLRFKSSQKRS